LDDICDMIKTWLLLTNVLKTLVNKIKSINFAFKQQFLDS